MQKPEKGFGRSKTDLEVILGTCVEQKAGILAICALKTDFRAFWHYLGNLGTEKKTDIDWILALAQGKNKAFWHPKKKRI